MVKKETLFNDLRVGSTEMAAQKRSSSRPIGTAILITVLSIALQNQTPKTPKVGETQKKKECDGDSHLSLSRLGNAIAAPPLTSP